MTSEPAVYDPSTKLVVAVADALKIPLEKAFRILLDLHDAGVEVRLIDGCMGD